MIIVLQNADFSDNNIGKVEIKTIDQVSEETKGILRTLGDKPLTNGQIIAFDTFWLSLKEKSWFSKIQHLLMPILCPVDNNWEGIKDFSVKHYAYDLISKNKLTLTSSGSTEYGHLANTENGLTLYSNIRNYNVKLSFDAPKDISNIHLASYFRSSEVAGGRGLIIFQYSGGVSAKSFGIGAPPTRVAYLTQNPVDQVGFRLVSNMEDGKVVFCDSNVDVEKTGTVNKYESDTMQDFYVISTAGNEPVNEGDIVGAMFSLGLGLTLDEAKEYRMLVDSLMSSLWIK